MASTPQSLPGQLPEEMAAPDIQAQGAPPSLANQPAMPTQPSNKGTKTGLRSVLAGMLQGFSYGAGQAMKKEAGLPTDAEIAEQNAKMAFTNAQARLMKQQADLAATMVEVELQDGTKLRVPQSAVPKVVTEKIKALGGVEKAKATASAASERQEDQQKFTEEQNNKNRELRVAQLDKMIAAANARQDKSLVASLQRAKLLAGATGDPRLYTDAIETGEIDFNDVPRPLRTDVLSDRVERGKLFVPPSVRKQLAAYSPARKAIDHLETTLEEYLKNPNVETYAQYSATRDGITRVEGRALGEVGVFTDQDSANFKKLTSVNPAMALAMPDMARERIKNARKLLEDVGEAKFGDYLKAFDRNAGVGQGKPSQQPAQKKATHRWNPATGKVEAVNAK
jgi:hypothetical protein